MIKHLANSPAQNHAAEVDAHLEYIDYNEIYSPIAVVYLYHPLHSMDVFRCQHDCTSITLVMHTMHGRIDVHELLVPN